MGKWNRDQRGKSILTPVPRLSSPPALDARAHHPHTEFALNTTDDTQDVPHPPLGYRIAGVASNVLLWIGIALLALQLMLAWRSLGVPAPLLWAALSGVAVFLFVMILHEAGHVLGARLAGMHPFEVRLGPVRLLRRRRGWRLFRSPAGERGWMAMAFPSPARPLRPQLIAFAAGGPLANLVAAALLGGFAFMAEGPAMQVLSGIAVSSLCLGLANLMPYLGHAPSDGLLLLGYAQGLDEDAPEVVFARLNGMAMEGVTADRLPPHLVQRLADADQPLPLVHVWFRLKALQQTGRWAEAVALAPVLEERSAAVPEPLRPMLADFVAQLRVELAFSSAMLDRRAEAPLESGIPRVVDQQMPMLRSRCRALQAILEGDHASAHEHLRIAQAQAEDSVDAALRQSERRIRDALAALIGTPPAPREPQAAPPQ